MLNLVDTLNLCLTANETTLNPPLSTENTSAPEAQNRIIPQHRLQSKTSTAQFFSRAICPPLSEFSYFVAFARENNQTQAENMLQKNQEFSCRLISEQHDIEDAVGRRFTQPLSAYEYAFWAGDTRMCLMMDRFMDKDTEAVVKKQCKNIEENGLSFTLNKELVQHSKHFDFQLIISAYHAYIEAVEALDKLENCSEEKWGPLEELCLNFGKTLATVPTHLAQEYCSKQPFAEYAEFQTYNISMTDDNFTRTTEYFSWISRNRQSWYTPDQVNSYHSLSTLMYWPNLDCSSSSTSASQLQRVFITKSIAKLGYLTELLHEERIVYDREQILNNLKSIESCGPL